MGYRISIDACLFSPQSSAKPAKSRVLQNEFTALRLHGPGTCERGCLFAIISDCAH
jgi:hypothetical protein